MSEYKFNYLEERLDRVEKQVNELVKWSFDIQKQLDPGVTHGKKAPSPTCPSCGSSTDWPCPAINNCGEPVNRCDGCYHEEPMQMPATEAKIPPRMFNDLRDVQAIVAEAYDAMEELLEGSKNESK